MSAIMMMVRKAAAVTGALVLVVSCIVLNVAQMLSLAVLPFSGVAFRKFNRFLADKWWGGCVILAERVVGTRLVFSGDHIPPRENAIVMCNHQSGVDIIMLLCLGFRKGRLGDLKWFVKDILKYVPGVGWGMLFLDCLYVKRDWASDERSIRATFEKLIHHEVPVWLASFLEGTRKTPEKLKRSQEYAQKQRLPVPRNLLVPRTKGFVATVLGLGNHVDAVYDITIGYPAGAPSLVDLILCRQREVHLHLRRFAVSKLPLKDEELALWTQARFQEKDDLLDAFNARGQFPGPALNEPLFSA